MGYTLELWALRVETLVGELTQPSIRPEQAALDGNVPADVGERWGDLAGAVAGAIRRGGGELGGALAVYVHVVIRTLGTYYGGLDHTSSGGNEFRRRFLPGPAAQWLGLDFVAALVNRALAGLTWADYPVIGWASVDELGAAAARAASAVATPLAPEDVEPLEVLLGAVRKAARVGIDLVSAYG